MENKHTPGIMGAKGVYKKGNTLVETMDVNCFTICRCLHEKDGERITLEQAEANAERIALCWNEHDSLTEQVKQLQEEKKELVRVLGYANAQLSSLQGSYKPQQIGYLETAAVIKDIQSLLSKYKTT